MKVQDLMTRNPTSCLPHNTLAEAAGLMWESDCGIIPVVAEDGKIVGLITDRDICMAAALTGRVLDQMAVSEIMSGNVVACKGSDEIRPAMLLMQQNQVRRLAVLADDGTLAGILSLNDLVLSAQETPARKTNGVSYADLITTYKAICTHPQVTKVAHRAAGA